MNYMLFLRHSQMMFCNENFGNVNKRLNDFSLKT